MFELIASSLMAIKWQFLWQKKHYWKRTGLRRQSILSRQNPIFEVVRWVAYVL
jgi:hypothetical protein